MDDEEVLFGEIQQLKQRWIWVVLAIVNAILLFGVYKQIIMGEEWGIKPMSNMGLLITTLITLSVTFLIKKIQLETKIKEDGIYVRFFPIHVHFRFYNWKRISKCYIRHYSALTEFGGWGIRFSIFGKGIAYNISGDKGLQLILKNKKKILIGTLLPEEMERVVKELEQWKS